jgi:5-(carboxyamino)imidazole ribonucleotide mutase/phosphoribosylaminoimidazole-succinocarboxamide synthase
MGSKSDLAHGEQIVATLERLGVRGELRVGSAHKSPAHVLAMLQAYEEDPRPKVYITIAGRSNALSGFVDAQVSAPVIACPPVSSSFGGADIYSSLRMPSGVAPGVVLEPVAAALLAAKIFGVSLPAVRARVAALQEELRARILEDDGALVGASSDD